MAQMTLPSAPSYRRTSYSGLLGCDFSVDPALVSRKRSPDCLNMISDNGGNPVKRKGWEVVGITEPRTDSPIENVWTFKADDGDGLTTFVVYTVGNDEAESDLWCTYADEVWQGRDDRSYQYMQLTTGGNPVRVPRGKLGAFYTDISDSQYGLYILAGYAYFRIYYDEELKCEEVTPHIPTITISRSPTGGGEAYEEVNLLTKECAETFLNETGNREFHLTLEPRAEGVRVWYLGGQNGNQWIEEPSGNITVTPATRKVTLTTAHDPVVAGEDNIKIQYTVTGDDNFSKILYNTETAHFSKMIYDQIFLTGNPNMRNTVFYSKVNDITYFPDTYYLKMNGESNAKGFLNVGEYLAVVKEGSAMDSTVFLIYPTTYNSTETTAVADGTGNVTLETKQKSEWTFAMKRSIAGIGAVSNRAFAVLGDEPLFLSANGVYGITSVDTTSDKIVRNRSFLLDQKLTREPNLENAVATEWMNYYVLVVNGHAYILDGRHKTNNYAGNTSYGYESYYWENIPAISISSCEEELWFGTADGRLCRFKTSGELFDYADNTAVPYYVTNNRMMRVATRDEEEEILIVRPERWYTSFSPAEDVEDSNILIAENLSDELLEVYHVGAIMCISQAVRSAQGDLYYRSVKAVETVGTTTTFVLSGNVTISTTHDITYWGEVITARWSTPLDNDDMSEYFKTMQKKGTMCTVAPYTRSSVNVYINADGYGRRFVGKSNVDKADLFDGTIDFEHLSFDTSTAPRDYFFRKKRKKYKRLQIILENDDANEPFGVFEIVKTYIYQRFAK